MTERLNSAVTALMTDHSLLSRFRRRPVAAMRRFRLSECELDAVKSGDERRLLAHGLAPELISGRPRAPHWFGGLVGTVARRLAAPVVIAVMLALAVQAGGAPVARAGRVEARVRMRAMRRSGPKGGPVGLRRASSGRAGKRVQTIQRRVTRRASYGTGLSRALTRLSGGDRICKPGCD